MNTWAIALLMSVAGYLLAPVPIRRRPIYLRGREREASPRSSRTPGEVAAEVARRTKQHFRRRRSQDAARAAAVELVAAFAADLRAGQPVRQAFTRAQRSSPVPLASRAVSVAELGGDVPRVLRSEAQRVDLPILQSLAALWRVAEGSGAGLAQAADRLAIAEAANQVARAEVAAQLAGPRATAKVLAGLPIVGVILGSGLGASPIAWLFGSVWGLLVLAVGVGLECLGLWWISRLTKSVERSL